MVSTREVTKMGRKGDGGETRKIKTCQGHVLFGKGI